MVEVVLTEVQTNQCNLQTLDWVLKFAVAGAAACVIWNALVVKNVVDRSAPSRWLRERVPEKYRPSASERTEAKKELAEVKAVEKLMTGQPVKTGWDGGF